MTAPSVMTLASDSRGAWDRERLVKPVVGGSGPLGPAHPFARCFSAETSALPVVPLIAERRKLEETLLVKKLTSF